MKAILCILVVFSLGICQMPRHFETRPAGVVTDIKILGMTGSVVSIGVMTNSGRFIIVKAQDEIPCIYIGDTLNEYWLNYQKVGVGTTRAIVIYKIDERR